MQKQRTCAGSWPRRGCPSEKTWLLFESAIISFGEAELPQVGGLVTTVEQANVDGPVHVGTASNNAGPMAAGTSQDLDLSVQGAWVTHDGVGCLLPKTAGAVAHVSIANKTGEWSSIGVGSDAPVTMPAAVARRRAATCSTPLTSYACMDNGHK